MSFADGPDLPAEMARRPGRDAATVDGAPVNTPQRSGRRVASRHGRHAPATVERIAALVRPDVALGVSEIAAADGLLTRQSVACILVALAREGRIVLAGTRLATPGASPSHLYRRPETGDTP